MNHDWSCRHCEHWRLGPLGPPASYFSLAPTCALGFKPSLVRSIKSCAHYSREPGADDELDTLPDDLLAGFHADMRAITDRLTHWLAQASRDSNSNP